VQDIEAFDSVPTVYIDANETAKLIRQTLRAAFPGQKFSVRKSRGGSVYVTWTDGPSSERVRNLVLRFEGSSFDPMIDLKSSREVIETDGKGGARRVQYGIDYVLTQREISEEWAAELAEELALFADKTHGQSGETVRASYAAGDFTPLDVIIETDKGLVGVRGSGTRQTVRSYAEKRDATTELALSLLRA
jgi:hypothetical protein